MTSTASCTPAQTKALRQAEHTPHGWRLPYDTHVNTCVAMADRGLTTHLTTPPGTEDDDAPRAHWLTPLGEQVRAALPPAPKTAPCPQNSRNGLCDRRPSWVLSAVARIPEQEPVIMQTTYACNTHMAKAATALRKSSPRTLPLAGSRIEYTFTPYNP